MRPVYTSMPIHNFPFIRLTREHKRTKPRLAIKITNRKNGKSIRTFGLIDTGADKSSFPEGLGKALDVELKEEDARQVNTAGGPATVYACDYCDLEIFDSKDFRSSSNNTERLEKVYTIKKVPIDFSPTLRTPLIGVEGVLDQFILEVDYAQKTFSMRKPESGLFRRLLRKLGFRI